MKRNLGKIIALSLLTASVFTIGGNCVYAKEYVGKPDVNKIILTDGEPLTINVTTKTFQDSGYWADYALGNDFSYGSYKIVNVDVDGDINLNVDLTESNGQAGGVEVQSKDFQYSEEADMKIHSNGNINMAISSNIDPNNSYINQCDLNGIISRYRGNAQISAEKGIKVNVQSSSTSAYGVRATYGIIGMKAQNIEINTQAPDGKINAAINSQSNGDIKINAQEQLSAQSKGNLAYTIYAWGGKVDIKSTSNNIKSDFTGILAYDDRAKNDGSVNLIADDVNEVTATNTALFGHEYGTINLEAKKNIINSDNYAAFARLGSSVSIKSSELTQMTGNVHAETDSVVNVNYDSQDSFLKGFVTTKNATTNLGFTNGALWTMTGNSNVTNLKADGVLIDMTKNDKGNAGKLTVDRTLTGTGSTFVLDLDAANKNNKQESATSDYIYLNGTSEGAHNILFDVEASKISTDMNVGDKLYFAYVQDSNATFDSAVNLEKVSAENIYNYKYGVDSDVNADKQGNDWYIGLTDKTENENVSSVDGAMKAGYALGTEMDRLNKRLGESRYLTDEKGLWVRYRHARVGMDNSFKTNSNMFQLGYDKEVMEDDGGHYRGGALDYTHGDTSLSGVGGTGEHDRYSLSLYDTWMGDKGHYRDLVIRGGRINSEFDVNTRQNDRISSDYHQWFGSISGEWGRKKETGHDWYFEPQTQLQLARVGGADYVTNYGVRVEQDGATSLIGRLGFRLGREFDKADATKRDNYYIKADLLHEFCGDQEYRVTGADGYLSKKYDGKDTWFDVGVGADVTISRNTYFWVDVERTLGGDYDRTWQVNGGFRWEF